MSGTETLESTYPMIPSDPPLYEVVNGREVELPPMGIPANWITSRLQVRLGLYAEERKLGQVIAETLFILDRTRNLRRRPDLAFVSAGRWPLDRPLPEAPAWDVIPDLAVEVISPTDLYQEVVGKVREYFYAGVRAVWIVLPRERQVYVYSSPIRVEILDETADFHGGDVLPGFRLQLGNVFPSIAQAEPPSGS